MGRRDDGQHFGAHAPVQSQEASGAVRVLDFSSTVVSMCLPADETSA